MNQNYTKPAHQGWDLIKTERENTAQQLHFPGDAQGARMGTCTQGDTSASWFQKRGTTYHPPGLCRKAPVLGLEYSAGTTGKTEAGASLSLHPTQTNPENYHKLLIGHAVTPQKLFQALACPLPGRNSSEMTDGPHHISFIFSDVFKERYTR